MKFKNMSLFYKIYFSALAVFFTVLIIGAVALNIWLGEYNKGIPETVSKNFFEENFVNKNTENIVKMSGITPTEFESAEDVEKHIAGLLENGELSYTSISAGAKDGEKKYIVKSGEYKIASFTLAADEKNDYYPETLTLHIGSGDKVHIKALDSSKVFINGVEVGEKYITDTAPHRNSAFLPDGVKGPEWVTYTVKGLTSEPVITITDRNGNNPEASENDGILTESIIWDSEEKELCNLLLTAAKQYAICMQNDASKGSALKYFEKGTNLYNDILTAENYFVWDHSGYEFEDVSVSEFFRYDENTVSCRISFVHILKKYGRPDYRDKTDITYFARKVGNSYLIYDRCNN